MNNKDVLKFQKECFEKYISDIRERVPAIPEPYIYPDGNPIRPVLSISKEPKTIMLVGAFPSAKFERRNKVLIPTGDNLSPFGSEEYFDGAEVRTQASRDSLDEKYFSQLGITANNIWITDLVKVYLFPEKHIKNCKLIAPKTKFVDTHKLFSQIASASMKWMTREIQLCNPKLIITLGDVSARTISGDRKTKTDILLNGEIRTLNLNSPYNIAHLGHPEIRRRNEKWDSITEKAITKLAKKIQEL